MNNFNREVFKKILILAKGTRGINQFALQSGISSSYISELINLKRGAPPSMNILTKIAAACRNNINLNDLMRAAGYIETLPEENDNLDDLIYVKEDLDDLIHDDLIYKENKIDDFVLIPFLKNIRINDRTIFNKNNILKYDYEHKADVMYATFFYYFAPDNSMVNSKINKGDVLTIKYSEKLENNKIFFVLLHNVLTLRRIFIQPEFIILATDNSKFKPEVFNIDTLNKDCIQVIGKVTYVKFKL